MGSSTNYRPPWKYYLYTNSSVKSYSKQTCLTVPVFPYFLDPWDHFMHLWLCLFPSPFLGRSTLLSTDKDRQQAPWCLWRQDNLNRAPGEQEPMAFLGSWLLLCCAVTGQESRQCGYALIVNSDPTRDHSEGNRSIQHMTNHHTNEIYNFTINKTSSVVSFLCSIQLPAQDLSRTVSSAI